jgi:tetratricopeptide (TPR) repeat protein
MNTLHSIRILAAFSVLLAAPAMNAQNPPQDPSSKPANPPNDDMKPKSPPKPNKDAPTQSAPDQPTWDPLRADKDMEVGQYYLHKGDLDAAIDRFQDAILAKPGYAIPFRFLGEAQEKRGLKKQAIKSYQRYLDLYPHAEDGEKIKKKIDKLYKEVEKEKEKEK